MWGNFSVTASGSIIEKIRNISNALKINLVIYLTYVVVSMSIKLKISIFLLEPQDFCVYMHLTPRVT